MVNLDKSTVVKLKKEGKHYEILVDAEKALEFKKGKNVNLDDVLATDEVFYDAKRGTKASESELRKIFGTDNKSEVCKLIIMNGSISLTADMMKRDVEERRKQVIQLIHRNAIDPKTGKPHPPNRIENAMDEAKVRVDANKTAEQQVSEIIKQINSIIPIKVETREINVKIPSQYAGKSYSTVKQFGKIKSEKWENDGSLNCVVEMPAGMQEEFELALNSLSKGTVQMKVMENK